MTQPVSFFANELDERRCFRGSALREGKIASVAIVLAGVAALFVVALRSPSAGSLCILLVTPPLLFVGGAGAVRLALLAAGAHARAVVVDMAGDADRVRIRFTTRRGVVDAVVAVDDLSAFRRGATVDVYYARVLPRVFAFATAPAWLRMML